MSSPYFIWPNVNPFRRAASLINAVPPAGNIGQVADGAGGLGIARQWVRDARKNHLGIFDISNPLMLQPFELRLLARREPLYRWVIDLSDPNTMTLLRPEEYYVIPNPEDRLFVPEAYVPLFRGRGWQ